MKKKNMLLFATAVSVLTILLLLAAVMQDKPLAIDQSISGVLSHFPKSWDPVFLGITELGDKKGIGIVGILMLLWLLIKRRDFFAMGIFALGVALGNEANKILKELIGRERPDLEHLVHVKSLSFPSGHAMVGSILYLLIAYFLIKEYKKRSIRRVISVCAGLIILLIGASRIILNVHYPTDIIGGYAFGFIWATVVLFAYEWLRNKYPVLKGPRKI